MCHYFLFSVKEEEQTFETVVEPLLEEEWEINYAYQALMLRMFTKWPICANFEFQSDLHHVNHH